LSAERHEQVTVLFADIVGFTTLSDQLHPSEVMTLLCDLYKGYDERAVELGLYTVDTIGDCYMCAANLVKPLPNHVNVMVGFAQDIIEIANTTLSPLGTTLSIRVGIHTGPLMSGVIGVHRLKFTLVGDTVNVASRMESTAITNTLQISEHAYMLLRREQLAMLPEAAMGQSVDVEGFGDLPDMHGQEKGACSMVRGDSAPPSLLAFLQDERGAALTELERFLGSSTANRNGKALNSQAGRQEQQQHGQGQRREEKQQRQTPDGQQLQRQHCQEQQQQQQQSFHSQPEAQGKKERWHSKLQESWCLGKSYSLSQGAVSSPCPEAPAEQSSHTLQPDGLDWDWLERKLDVKGKGIMKAYTYIGPSPPS
ncbi:nucleotide cyclase, partial [Dunaliella salina]